MKDEKMLDYPELKKLFNVSRTTLDRWEKMGKFPKRIHIGENSIRWLKCDIQEWINKKIT